MSRLLNDEYDVRCNIIDLVDVNSSFFIVAQKAPIKDITHLPDFTKTEDDPLSLSYSQLNNQLHLTGVSTDEINMWKFIPLSETNDTQFMIGNPVEEEYVSASTYNEKGEFVETCTVTKDIEKAARFRLELGVSERAMNENWIADRIGDKKGKKSYCTISIVEVNSGFQLAYEVTDKEVFYERETSNFIKSLWDVFCLDDAELGAVDDEVFPKIKDFGLFKQLLDQKDLE